ncbi:MAG: hypothetical protein HOP12_04355, partial [Candidatus Eisenbacteria bacterium]|nr:hypothetical protein [Candidatus Eisenbacteria bacterium]
MDAHMLTRRATLGLAGSALALGLMVRAARGEPASATPTSASKIRIHDADETLRDYCEWDGTCWWLTLPSGTRFELIGSTHDPAILNPGDGEFHPFDAAEVRAALAAVRYPLEGVACEIFLLPYPRRFGLDSAADRELILLSPGVRSLSPERQHAEVVHELGHVMHLARLPDHDLAGWANYRGMRGIADAQTYAPDAPHANRPHEIFAEDFRVLFGGALAVRDGAIENAAIAPPAAVVGLEGFLLGLSGVVFDRLAAART